MDLKEYLDKYHIRPADFAKECGVAIPTVYAYLKGSRFPRAIHRKTIFEKTGGRVRFVRKK